MSSALTILIVDDEYAMHDILKEFLSGLDCEINISSTGREAMACIDNFSYDLVFLDIMLPDISGFDVLDHLRQQFPDSFVAMMTAYPSEISVTDVLSKGAHYYFEKPLDREELVAIVTNAHERKALKSERKKRLEKIKEGLEKLQPQTLESKINSN